MAPDSHDEFLTQYYSGGWDALCQKWNYDGPATDEPLFIIFDIVNEEFFFYFYYRSYICLSLFFASFRMHFRVGDEQVGSQRKTSVQWCAGAAGCSAEQGKGLRSSGLQDSYNYDGHCLEGNLARGCQKINGSQSLHADGGRGDDRSDRVR